MRRILVFIFVMRITSAWAQIPDPVLQTFKQGFNRLAKHCKMDYSATCLYPDTTQVEIQGMMALSQGFYFDSSNTRTVLMNKEWFLNFDHTEKQAAILNFKRAGFKPKDVDNLMISEFLFSDSLLFKASKVSKDNPEPGKFWLRFKFDKQPCDIKFLNILFESSTMTPIAYEGEYDYTIEDNSNEFMLLDEQYEALKIRIRFKCSNVTTQFSDAIFSEDRFIEYRDKGAYLKQYRNYKMYTSKY